MMSLNESDRWPWLLEFILLVFMCLKLNCTDDYSHWVLSDISGICSCCITQHVHRFGENNKRAVRKINSLVLLHCCFLFWLSHSVSHQANMQTHANPNLSLSLRARSKVSIFFLFGANSLQSGGGGGGEGSEARLWGRRFVVWSCPRTQKVFSISMSSEKGNKRTPFFTALTKRIRARRVVFGRRKKKQTKHLELRKTAQHNTDRLTGNART